MLSVSRRALTLLGFAALIVPHAAFANDDVVARVLDALTNAFAASAKMTAGVTARVTGLKPAAFKPTERKAVAEQVADFDDSLGQMAMVQRVVVGDIGDYIASVRAHGFSEKEHGPMWRALVSDMRGLATRVQIVQDMQAKATWLSVTLSPEDEMALGDMLRARATLLDELTDLPAPRTPIQIDKLDALHGRYIELMKQLAALRVALANARRLFV